jgi:hypothetical protein
MEQTSIRERIRPSGEVDRAYKIWEATGFPKWGDVEQWLKAKEERLPQKGKVETSRQGPSPLNRRG